MAMTLRPNEQQDAALTRLAARWGMSKQAAAMRAIEEMDARERGLAEVEAAGRRSLDRWGPVYDALADA
jgi:hypothetical protein